MALTTLLESLSIPRDVLDKCMDSAQASGINIEQALFEAGAIDELDYLALVGKRYEMELVPELEKRTSSDDSRWSEDAALIKMLPLAWLRKHGLVPLRDVAGKIVLAVSRPSGWLHAQELAILTGERPSACILAPEQSIKAIVNRVFGDSEEEDTSVSDMLGEAESIDIDDNAVEDLLEESSDAPFIKTVNTIIAQAVRAGASDIHIEPYRDFSRVRFRLDGVLYERHTINKAHHPAVVSRIKVMAKLNIAEKRFPQDGRIAIVLGGREASLRVSTLPTSFGERVVLRLLEKNERVLSLGELGLSGADFELLSGLSSSSHGIVLVTGPTGSGKTTTLYAVLQEISSTELNIMTIEDPVEYELDGVAQMQVNHKINLGFADGLRAIVRQDPDVILIGEIRDEETASIAVQSALTGHLVFSTLHTNDAPGAVTRLFDMGVEPFLLSSVLRGVIAQRLVRILCPHCKIPHKISQKEKALFAECNISCKPTDSIFTQAGCDQCMGTGYKGRMAIYEIMRVSDGIRQEIVSRADANKIRQLAIGEGMKTLRQDGMQKVLAGHTTFEEVERVVRL